MVSFSNQKFRNITDGDIAHYHKIVVALSNTIRLIKEFDQVIEPTAAGQGRLR